MREELELVRRLQTAMGAAEISLAQRMGLTPRDMTALMHIAFSPDAITPSDLGERLGVTRGAVTELVDRLERAGHVERRRAGVDRRRVDLVVTAATTQDVVTHLDDLFTGLDAVFAGLDARDSAVVGGALARIADAYDRYGAAAPRAAE